MQIQLYQFGKWVHPKLRKFKNMIRLKEKMTKEASAFAFQEV